MSDDTKDDCEVIRPDFKNRGFSLGIKPRSEDRVRCCSHRTVQVGENDRTVSCGSCGAYMDPVSILLEYARHERTFAWCNDEQRKISDNVKELGREEKRIKSRIATAKKQLAKLSAKQEELGL